MNPDEIDIMKLTPEDYLKMWDRCKELERDNILKRDHILELEKKNAELSATILKDADAKIQSANWERVRYLERKLRDVESLNDSLMKELARREPKPTTGVITCEIKVISDTAVYQEGILKYAPDFDTVAESMAYAAIGLCGEAGEASEIVKKHVYHDHPLDDEHLMRELGDVLWYVTYMAHLLNCPLSTIMALNLDKLAKRYPDGKFDAERSRHREEGDI